MVDNRRKRHRVERTKVGDLPDIDAIYIPDGHLKRELEDPLNCNNRGFKVVKWESPPKGHILASSDAAVPQDGSGNYGYGYALRNRKGKLKKYGFGCSNRGDLGDGKLIAYAEMFGIYKMLDDIDAEKYPHVIVCNDNKEVINALDKGSTKRDDLGTLLDNISQIITLKYPIDDVTKSLKFEVVQREQNFTADWLSNKGLRLSVSSEYHLQSDSEEFKVQKDKTLRYFLRRDREKNGYLRNVRGRKKNNANKRKKNN